MCIPRFVTQFVNFDAKTFPSLGNILLEDDPALKFYNYLIHCKMLGGVIEFSIRLVRCVKDGPYFP
jgi:hypothetical protein